MNEDAPTRRVGPDDYATGAGLAVGRQVFGRFMLEAVAGRGGMGVVWRGRDEELGETVALKFLPEVIARDPAAIDELRQETRRARQLTHPHIVRIHDFLRDEALAAVSMEYVDGVTLTHLRLEQPGKVFPVERLAPLIGSLCSALDYAHMKAKIVHRDLKPANVLVTREGEVKVTDFGIARSLTESSTRLTGKGGDTSGTLPYMSPQQVLGTKPAATDDIYSLGAMLYELLTSKPPFFRGDAYTLMMQIRERVPLSMARQRAELEVTGGPIPQTWEETIKVCLAKEPKDRPKTAGEVARRLGITDVGLQGETPVTDDQPTVHVAETPKPMPAPRSKRLLPALIAAFVLLGLGAGYYFGVYAPGQKRRADEAQSQEQQIHAAAEAEKQRIAQEAERQRKEKEQAEAAAQAKADQEQHDYATMVARIAAVRDDSPRTDLDAAERAEQGYLAVAPERFKGGVQQAWESRRRAWLAYEASHRLSSLTVKTDPADATVILYPRNERKNSPADFEDIPPGEISFRVEKEGYEPQDQRLVIQPGTQNHPDPVRLISLTGSALITSQPSGAKVSLDGNSRHFEGVTPFSQSMIPPGSYQMTLQRENWRPVVNPITIKRNEEATLAVDLRGVNLHIESAPVGALVTLNGKESGVTPLNLTDQPPGQYQVTLTNAGYDPAGRTIVAENDTTVTIPLVRSIPKMSTLVIYREAHFIGAMNSPIIIMKGQFVGKLPNGSYMTVECPAGEADLNVQAGFAVGQGRLHVELPPGKTTYLKMSFVTKGLLDAADLEPVIESVAKSAISSLKPVLPESSSK